MRLIYFFGVILVCMSCSKDPINQEIISHIPYVENNMAVKNNQSFFQDLEYGSHSQQTFDLYKPLNEDIVASKVIITIHGGGWMNGDKSSMINFVSKIQESNPNHTVVNMNYRLATNEHYAFPNQFIDIDNLINYLSTNSSYFNIQPEFALIGKSAGGHLALMYDSVYDINDKVKVACALAGPTNFVIPFFMEDPDYEYLFELLIDPSYNQDRQKTLKLISPFHQVSTNNSPTLLFHGVSDTKVPFENSSNLKTELNNYNIPSKLIKLEEGHSSWSEESMETVNKTIKKFIEQHL